MDYISTSLSNTWLCPPPPHFFTVPVNSSQIAELDSAILRPLLQAEIESMGGITFVSPVVLVVSAGTTWKITDATLSPQQELVLVASGNTLTITVPLSDPTTQGIDHYVVEKQLTDSSQVWTVIDNDVSPTLITQTSAEEEEVTGVAVTVVSTGAESYRIRIHAVDTEDNAAPTSDSSDWMNVVTNGAIGQSGTPVAEDSTDVTVVD